jgi:integrase/recombinase XerD
MAEFARIGQFRRKGSVHTMLWDEAVEGFWLARSRNLSDHTVSDYSVTFKRFGKWIKYGDVERVTVKQVNAFLTYLGDELELAPKTVLNAWIALSSFWTWAAVDLGCKHIMRDTERPHAQRRTMQPFSEEEVRAMLEACATMRAYDPRHKRYVNGHRPSAHRDAAILLVLLDTGLRVSELCNLVRRDYDRKQGRLIVEHGKGDKQRTVFCGQAAQRALWRYLATRNDVEATDPIFATAGGRHMDSAGVRMMIVRCGERAGVAGATPHRFRHTFAVNFLRNGGNMAALQDLLGHSTLEMVRRYARLAEVDLADAQRKASPADRWRL